MLHVHWKPGAAIVGGKPIQYQPGERLWSIQTWADLFRWSRGKTIRFFDLLKNCDMIDTVSVGKSIRLSVCNWEQYQGGRSDTDLISIQHRSDTDLIPITGKERKKERTKKQCRAPRPEVVEVVGYLNKKAGKDFRAETTATQRHIGGRLKAGYTVEDMKAVVDLKVSDWMGTSAEQYLRPNTLFNEEKFESYVQVVRSKSPKPKQSSNYDHRRTLFGDAFEESDAT